MLLLTGHNLGAARITASYPGVRVARVDAQRSGRYVFVWLAISAEARPGTITLTVETPAGRTTVNFPLLARSAARGEFQGITEDDVIYLIMPDRFADGDPSNDQPPQSPGTYDRSQPRAYHGGDLRGIRHHLPYLRELGVTALWLTPLYDNDNTSAGDYHGYGAVDFYAVDEHFGDVEELEALITAAHEQGIKVFLDLVINHTGSQHPWVEAAPLPHWFHGDTKNHLAASPAFNYLTDPHAVPQQWRPVVEGWFGNILPDLNQENQRVAEYLAQNALWWAERVGVDGYRLDTFPYVSRRFWTDWHRRVFRAYPHFSTIAEVFNGDPSVTAFFAGGRKQFDGIDSGVTTIFDFPFFFALRDIILRGAPALRLEEVLQRDWLYAHPERLVTFLGNHDVKRFMSESSGSKEKLKLAYALLLTARGIPQLYYGDEIGLQGGEDPDNRRDFPGGFPGDARNAFTPEGRTPDEQEIFSHVQSLLRLRQQHPALRRGRHWYLAGDQTFYAFVRETTNERVLVIFNSANQPRRLRLNLEDTPLASSHALEPLLSAEPAVVRANHAELEVAARSVSIYLAK